MANNSGIYKRPITYMSVPAILPAMRPGGGGGEPPPPPPPEPPPPLTIPYAKGIDWNAFSPWNNTQHQNERLRLQELSDAGQHMDVRMLMRWSQIEPTEGDFTHWDAGNPAFGWDGMVNEAFESGYEIVHQVAGFIPTYAQLSGGVNGLPDLTKLATLFTTVADRYAPGGSFVVGLGDGSFGIKNYIVENEVNLRSTTSIPPGVWTPTAAVNAAAAVYTPVKLAHPDVTVVAGALASGGYSGHPTNAAFLNQMFLHGLAYGVNTDAVLLNLYTGDNLDAMETQIAKIRTVMDANGAAACPIWITEYNPGLADTLVDYSHRTLVVADILTELFSVRAVQWLAAYNVQKIFIFALNVANGGLRLVHSGDLAVPINPPFLTFASFMSA